MATRGMPEVTRADLVRSFGAEFADRVEGLPPGEWRGPIESARGIHLVRVLKRHRPQASKFEDIESFLRQDWLMSQTRAVQQARVDEIRAGYRIEFVEE